MKKLINFKYVVTHPGRSHLDERLAVALALASLGHSVPVYRREPSREEVEDCNVLVLDVGGENTDWWNCFDHHQLPREHAPECAFSLVADAIGMKAELEAFYGWFGTWRQIDSKGPFAWAREHGIDWSVASTLLNPENDLIGRWWEEASGETPVDPALVDRLRKEGERIIAGASKFREFCNEVHAKGLKLDVDGIPVYDLRQFDANESLDNGNKLAKADGVRGGVLVSRDNRGPGDSYYRREDDPKMNFAKCGDKPYAAFAHVGGFILKTKEAGTDIQSVIRDAKA